MTNKVDYEWTIEDTDRYGDIHETQAMCLGEAITRSGAKSYIDNCKPVLVLIRQEGNENEGNVDRQWAYLTDRGLPAEFDGGALVPKYILNQYNGAI